MYNSRLHLDGAQVLIDAFVHLGMPIALESDDFIRALIYGQQSLVNGSQIDTRYDEAWEDAQPEQGENKLAASNPRLQLRQDADARADALGNTLKTWLDLIGEKKHVETQRAIESTLAKSGTVTIAARALSQAVPTPPVVPTPPKVSSVMPANNATGVKRNTNLTATFSARRWTRPPSPSRPSSSSKSIDGSTTQITNVTVTPSSDGLKAMLNPFGTSTTLLAKSTSYKAIVTTGAKDVAGYLLDQKSTTTGNQQMVWSFKTGLL